MRIVNERPPMWALINATFGIGDRPVIFCWGDTIYNPHGGSVTRELMKHEEIHSEQQGPNEDTIIAWWERYLVDPAFRYGQELPAHRAEYRAFCKRHGDRNARAKYLTTVARRLCGPLYGNLVSISEARERILLP